MKLTGVDIRAKAANPQNGVTLGFKRASPLANGILCVAALAAVACSSSTGSGGSVPGAQKSDAVSSSDTSKSDGGAVSIVDTSTTDTQPRTGETSDGWMPPGPLCSQYAEGDPHRKTFTYSDVVPKKYWEVFLSAGSQQKGTIAYVGNKPTDFTKMVKNILGFPALHSQYTMQMGPQGRGAQQP